MNTTERTATLTEIRSIFDQLDPRRQRDLLDYAAELVADEGR